jgi:parallel beta-helix repeat protein
VRVVNDTVTSSRPGSDGSEWPVQTFRSDATGASVVAVTGEVGGADPTAQDDPANGGGLNLGSITAQSLAPVNITAATAKSGVDFGFNFDTVVNANETGQGSLAQFITNSSLLTNANLAQAGLTAGTEHTLFMIPSDADPLGRPQDPNFSAARGVATITLDNAMPAITDADTAIDGTLQTTLIGDTNTGLLGAGGTAGVDGLAVSQVAAPEIEIRDDAAPIAIGLDVQANDTIVRGLAMFGFGDDNGEAAVLVANNITGTLVEGNVFGTPANTFTDPGAARRGQAAVESLGGDSGIIRNNLIGFNAVRGVFLNGAATGWTIENNEYRDNGLSTTDGDGIAFSDASGNSITGNLIAGSSSQGIVVTNSSGNVFTNNTVSGNGVGTASGVAQSAGITLRSTASATTFDRNIVQANYGAGIQVNDGASGIRMTLNSINDNGTVTARDGSPATGQIGIDLNAPGDDINLGTAPFYTLNDVGDGDTGGNNLLNFPVIASATTSGPTTTVVGTLNSLPNTTFELEFYSSTSADASGYGDGETSRGNDTVTTDGSGNANFSTVLASTVPLGDAVTVTSTDPSGNTSEFSGALLAGSDLAITKRAFFPDGTPIPNTATVPSGVLFHFLLYINNPNGGRLDISMQDVLDPGFTYEAGTLRLDNSVASCAAAACTPAEEAAIFTSVAGSAPLTDAVDADAGSFNGGNTVDAGDQNAANAQVDIAGNSVLALLVSVRFP